MYNIFVMSLYVLLFCLIKVASSISTGEFMEKFDRDGCIEGSILDMAKVEQLKTELSNEDTASVEESGQQDKTSENPLSSIHLLAAHNNLIYHYYLEKEEGPSHNRLFTVSLKLADEQYWGKGFSLKEAKKVAASEALAATKYPSPSVKAKDSPNASTPTVQLNSFAHKLGLKVTYLNKDELKELDLVHLRSKTSIPETKSHKGDFLASVNDTRNVGFSKPDEKPPFVVAVLVGDQKFIGTGYSRQAARHDAAAKALDAFKRMSEEEKDGCIADGVCDRDKTKSPISLVYEYAHLKQLNLEYKVVREDGPAHAREYVTRCTLGDFVTEGVGNSKKKSKHNASENMMANINVDELKLARSASEISLQKKNHKKKKGKVIRGTIERLAQDAKDFIASTIEYLSPSSNDGDRKILKKNQDMGDAGETTNFKHLLLEVSQQQGVTIHYSDLFKENSKYFSMLQIGLQPNYICLGDGQSFEEARMKASMEAINFLHKMGGINKFREQNIWTKTHEEECVYNINLRVEDSQQSE